MPLLAHSRTRKERGKSLLSCRYTALIFFAARLLVALTRPSREAPDEWWQSTEVAYRIVFGKGHLSWEWDVGIRSVTFPLFFAAPMYILKLIGCDTAFTIWAAPLVVQACIATAIDYYVMRICVTIDSATNSELRESHTQHNNTLHTAVRIDARDTERKQRKVTLWPVSPSVAQTAFWLQLLQWYIVCDGVRCLSNVAEALFVLAAFVESSYVHFLLIAALSCMVRVTSVFALLPIFVWHVYRRSKTQGIVRATIYCGVVATCMAAATCVLLVFLDYQLYGRFLFTPWRFAQFNIVAKISYFFGTHPFYWYVTSALPVIYGPHMLFLPLVPYMLWRAKASRARSYVLRVAGLFLWMLLCHSSVAHKEMRFIFSLLPLCNVLVSYVLSCIACAPHGIVSLRHSASTQRAVRLLHVAFLIANIFIVVLNGYVYYRGVNTLMHDLRRDAHTYEQIDVQDVCYLFPGLSYMHGQAKQVNILDCGVPTGVPPRNNYTRHEQSLYLENPKWFVLWRYERRLPAHDAHAAAEWLHYAKEMMPDNEPPRALPEGMLLQQNVAEELYDSFLRPHGYVKIANEADHLFGGDRGAYELWHKSKNE